MKIIIHPNEQGTITIVYPSNELPVEQVAMKDVPIGLPYKILDFEELPTDRTFRNAWDYVFDQPDGYGIGHYAWAARYQNKE